MNFMHGCCIDFNAAAAESHDAEAVQLQASAAQICRRQQSALPAAQAPLRRRRPMLGCPGTWRRHGLQPHASTRSARCAQMTVGCGRRWTTRCGTSRPTSTQEVNALHPATVPLHCLYGICSGSTAIMHPGLCSQIWLAEGCASHQDAFARSLLVAAMLSRGTPCLSQVLYTSQA